MRNILILFLNIILCMSGYSQVPYAIGISFDSVAVPEIIGARHLDMTYRFYCYKPVNYNSQTSPFIIALHGSGGNGAGTINNLITIANRQNAMIIAPNLPSLSQLAMFSYVDTLSNCAQYLPATYCIKAIYNRVINNEMRTNASVYMIGFSSGGQFVSRFMLVRQAYPDSIPIQMAVSADGYYYTFPTDSFLGTPMYWACGGILQPFNSLYCLGSDSIHSSFLCEDYYLQYYAENYGVLIGTNDVIPLNDQGCLGVQGANRFERAHNFYNFCDSNAINRGTTLQWGFAEVPGVGHDENLLYNTKTLPSDTFTIAERLLFQTSYHPVPNDAPIANFIADTTTIAANDTVNFLNLSLNAISYVWDFGDSSSLDFSINPFHIYTTPGLYPVRLSAIGSSGCSHWFQQKYYINVTSGVGLQEVEVSEVVIYPNPSQNIFKIETLNYNIYKLKVFEITGKEIIDLDVANLNNIEIDLYNYQKGLYILQIYNNSGGIDHYKLVRN